MTKRTSFLTRCLSMLLVLAMLLSNVNMGFAMRASAAEVKKLGAVLVENYGLTEETGAALVASGYVAGSETEVEYTAFDSKAEGLVTIDTVNSEIKANTQGEWTPVTATLKDEAGNEIEVVLLNEGKGNYVTEADTFFTEVTYVLNREFAGQQAILNAGAQLAEGMAALSTLSSTVTGDLGTIEAAIPSLVDVAHNGASGLYMGEAAVNAVLALNAAMESNGGALPLITYNTVYTGAASKSQYLMTNGNAFVEAYVSTYDNVAALYADDLVMNGLLPSVAPTGGVLIAAFQGAVGGQVEKMAPVAPSFKNEDGSAKKFALPTLNESVDYTQLDAMAVATGKTEKNPLTVATAVATAEMNMKSVAVTVTLNTAYETLVETAELKLPDGTSAETVVAEAQKKADALLNGAWAGKYVDGKFDAAYSVLDLGEAGLMENTSYTITYTAKTYTVTTEGFAIDGLVNPVPYDTKIKLPEHSDDQLAYKYMVNGTRYAQGQEFEVKDNTTVTREEVVAYTPVILHSAYGESFRLATGDTVAEAVLKTGALKGNENFTVGQPESTVNNKLLTLKDGTLTAQGNFNADSIEYPTWVWQPYSYGGDDGMDTRFSGNTATVGDVDSVYVRYALQMAGKEADYAKVLGEASEILAESAELLNGLATLYSYKEDLGEITYAIVGVLESCVDITNFSVKDVCHADMKAHFDEYLMALKSSDLTTGCMNNSNTGMRLYDLLNSDVSKDHLAYYYTKHAEFKKEVELLSGILNEMLKTADHEVAFAELLKTAEGQVNEELKPKVQKVGEKISTLKTSMADLVSAMNIGVHEAIREDTTAYAKLEKVLVDNKGKSIDASKATGTPVIVSTLLPAAKESVVYAQMDVVVGGETITVTTPTYDTDKLEEPVYFTEQMFNTLKSDMETAFEKKMGDGTFFLYEAQTSTGDNLDELVGQELTSALNQKIVYKGKDFAVTIPGQADQTVNVQSDVVIELAQPADERYYNMYNFPGVYDAEGEQKSTGKTRADSVSVTANEMVQMYNPKARSNGAYALEVVAGSFAEDYIDEGFLLCKTIEVVKKEGKTTGLIAHVDASDPNGLMGFAADLMNNGGWSVIKLNGKEFYNSVEITVQSLLDAMMGSADFNSDNIIASKNGEATMMKCKMQLAMNENDKLVWYFDGEDSLDFTLKFTKAPAQMVTAAEALELLQGMIEFEGSVVNNVPTLDLHLNLPEEAYLASLAAMYASNNLSKDALNNVDHDIAYDFLNNYILKFLTDENVTARTFINTLNRIIAQANRVVDKANNVTDRVPEGKLDLLPTSGEKYDKLVKYFDMLKQAYGQTAVTKNESNLTATMTAKGNQAEKLVNSLFDLGTFASMVKEFNQGEEGKLTVTVKATVDNLNKTYQAAVIDVNGAGKSNKFAYTENAAARVAEITGDAVVILTGDAGNLVFNHSAGDRVIKGQSVPHTVILDLNGMNVGSIANNGTGNLIIIDSNLDNTAAGNVGSVAGSNITILGGIYNGSVASHLKSGYAQFDGKTVSNALFHFEGSSAVDIVPHPSLFDPDQFGGKEDYVTTAMALAVDLGVDLVLKYYTSAMLSADGNDLLRVNFTDIVGLVTQETAADSVAAVVDEILGCINLDAEDGNPVGMAGGLDAFVNTVLAELLNVDKIYEVMYKGATPATWPIAVTEWKIETEHIDGADDGYITVNLVPDATKKHTKNLTLNYAKTLALVPDDYKDNFQQVMTWLSETVINEVDSKNETFAKIDLNEIKREGKNIVVGGGLETAVALDFSHTTHPYKPGETVDPTFYNKMLATMLAYGSDTVEAELAKYTDADGKLRDLNKAMFDVLDKITVGTFFEGLEKACESDVTIQQMIDKVGFIELEAEYIEKMQSAYDKVKATVLKVITKYDLTSIAKQPMAKYNDGSYTYTFSADMKDHTLDAFYKGYGVIANLKESKATLKIILVDDYRIVFDTTDADENVIKSLGDLWINDQCVTDELEGNTIWLKEAPTAEFAVSYTYADPAANGGFKTFEHMYVWKITGDPNNGRLFHATRIKALDDVLDFKGASILVSTEYKWGILLACNELTEAQHKAFADELGYKVKFVNFKGKWFDEDTVVERPVLTPDEPGFESLKGTDAIFHGYRNFADSNLNRKIESRFAIELEKIDGSGTASLSSGVIERNAQYVATQNVGKHGQYNYVIDKMLETAANNPYPPTEG